MGAAVPEKVSMGGEETQCCGPSGPLKVCFPRAYGWPRAADGAEVFLPMADVGILGQSWVCLDQREPVLGSALCAIKPRSLCRCSWGAVVELLAL